MSEMGAVERGATAMQARRRELISQPLDQIWPDLARAAIGALSQGEPVAWQYRYENEGGKWTAWRISRNHPNGGVEYPDCEVQPLYAAPAMPLAEAGVREALTVLDGKINALKKIGGWQTAEHRTHEMDLVIGYLIGAREEIAAL